MPGRKHIPFTSLPSSWGRRGAQITSATPEVRLAGRGQCVSVVGHNEQSAPWAVQETQQKFMIHTGTCPDFTDFLKCEGVSGYYKEFRMTCHFWGTGQRENFSACSIVNVVALIALIRGKGTSRFLATTSENFESC